MKRHRWTPPEDALICRLRAAGADLEAIASELPRRTVAAVRGRLEYLVAQGRIEPVRAAWSERDDERLRQLRSEGKGAAEIATEFPSRTPSAVTQRIGYLIREGRIDSRWAPIHERRAWTSREESRLVQLRSQGATLDEIAARLPRRTRSAVARRVAELVEDGLLAPGAHAPLSHRPWSQEEDELLTVLRRASKTPEEIAQALGRTVPSVKSRLAQRARKAAADE